MTESRLAADKAQGTARADDSTAAGSHRSTAMHYVMDAQHSLHCCVGHLAPHSQCTCAGKFLCF